MPNRRLPPLNSLEAFIRTVRSGSAKAAASELSISASALSRRLTQLEEFADKKLFTRGQQQLLLNEAGRQFYEAVAPMLDQLVEAMQQQLENEIVMRMRLGVLPLFGSQRLFPRLAELRKTHPKLHIDIDTYGHGESRLGESLDAAIILARDPDPALHQLRLDRNYVYAITNLENAAQIGPHIDGGKLSRQTFLVHNEMPESFTSWKKAIGIPDLEPAAVDHFDSGPLMLEAAAQGLGIAIMHDNHLSRSSDDRLANLFDIRIESPYSYWFVCRPRALEQPAVKIFSDWIAKTGL